MEQRFTFDQVASVYKASRPDYPEALIDDVLSYAKLKPTDNILEIGCGTGQATKSFATRGLQIIAIDPGPEMVRAARETLASFANVKLSEATFEAWPAGNSVFPLIIAAQSWHWVSPEVRFVKAAQLLSANGSLAVFGHVPVGLATMTSTVLPPSLTKNSHSLLSISRMVSSTDCFHRPPSVFCPPTFLILS